MSQPDQVDTPAQADQPATVQGDVQADAAQPETQVQASAAANDVASEEQRRQAEERRKRVEEQRARRRRQAATVRHHRADREAIDDRRTSDGR